ncbi:hypothetical protein ASC63_07040 [Leifsonia sp. Root112D2]|nr:hypothetical protein ASC63_07040 [Leifsonia sp. Root112D2]
MIRGRDDLIDLSTQTFLVGMRRDEAKANSWDWTRYDELIGNLIMLSSLLTEERRFSDAGTTLDEAVDLLRLHAPRHPDSTLLADSNRVLEAICLYNASVLFLETGSTARGVELLAEAGAVLRTAGEDERETERFSRTNSALLQLETLIGSE